MLEQQSLSLFFIEGIAPSPSPEPPRHPHAHPAIRTINEK